MATIVEELAEFAAGVTAADLPTDVIGESKRILLDTIGCAVASLDDEGAGRGVAYGQILGGPDGPASILGTGRTTSIAGAAFANAELVNALDQDAVLPPGHVTPYVVPGALATPRPRGPPVPNCWLRSPSPTKCLFGSARPPTTSVTSRMVW